MAAMVKASLLQHLVIAVLVLGDGQRSLSSSLDSSVASRTFGRMAGALSPVVRHTRVTSAKGRRSLSLEESEKTDRITSDGKEIEILMAFKSEITSDPGGELKYWRANDSDPCGWPGVGCSPDSEHVTALNLTGLNLVGTVSPLLGQLTYLQHLDVSQNLLHGPVPAALGNCSNLLLLNMSFNQMIGSIPRSLGQLVKLQTLDFAGNYLSGEIPRALANCSALQYLYLRVNFLAGGIPSELGALSDLKHLDLYNNSFSGLVPRTLGNCSSLVWLRLGRNAKLGGELPLDLRGLAKLEVFNVSECSFKGSFPVWTLNLTSLWYFNLKSNQFTGQLPADWRQLSNLTELNLGANMWDGAEIPREMSSLSRLEKFWLQGSNVVGKIPGFIVNMTSLRGLYLNGNKLTGDIPKDIGLLRNLEQLNLAENAFTGVLPSSLSNCSLLNYIYLGQNPGFDPQGMPSWIESFQNLKRIYFIQMNLHGGIPKEIGQLSQLEYVALFGNNLTGEIPATLRNCTALTVIDCGANRLTGQVPDFGHLSLQYFLIDQNLFSAGPLPPFIFNITSLTNVYLDDNLFNGSLDGDFGRLHLLDSFTGSGNSFAGPLPDSLSNCFSLTWLNLGDNQMTGTLPAGLANLTSLQYLNLHRNFFSGNIPSLLLRNSHEMQELDLSYNEFNGTIPVEVGQLGSLQYLYVNANQLVGAVPHSLAKCTQLLELDLSFNRLTSNIPGDAFASMPSLTTLNLSHNLFSGSWPPELRALRKIQFMDLSVNNISGPIPFGLGQCFLLETLDLSFNRLTGEIPRDLGLLKNLRTFNASYNNFSGPIPDVGAFKSNLTTSSFMGNPGLCGDILGPKRLCPVVSASHCIGFKCQWVLIPVISALGFVIVVLAAVYVSHRGYRKRDSGDLGLVTFSMDPSMKVLTKFDILAAIGAGDDYIIGRGPKSIVYKATLPDQKIIAIKVLTDLNLDEEKYDAKGFLSEAQTLAQLCHRNIVKVLGLYSTEYTNAILTEYMPRGSLHANLHGDSPCELTWSERFKIILGVTHALVYLHHEFPDTIIHRDLKPSNVLLDSELEPKLCDFGISKFALNENGEVTASALCGTVGYMPPEYGSSTRVSTKGDVYSFGVVLLELLIGKEVQTQIQSVTPSGQDEGLVVRVQNIFYQSKITPAITPLEILDPALRTEGACDGIIAQQMMLTLQLALFCSRTQPENRPSMQVVLEFLVEIEKMGQEPVTERTLENLLQENVVPSS